VLIAIATILNAVSGLGDTNQGSGRSTDCSAGERSARIAANRSTGEPTDCSAADTISGSSLFRRRTSARSQADSGNNQQAEHISVHDILHLKQ